MIGRSPTPRSPGRRRARRPVEPRADWLEARRLLASFTVTSAASNGPGSLREAIVEANRTADRDLIRFRIEPGGIQTIVLDAPLPAITSPVEIDGTSQPGYDPAAPRPMIELVGAMAGGTANGLVFRADAGGGPDGPGSTVRGLAIGGFAGAGIVLRGDGHLIAGTFIGLDATGAGHRGNGGIGVDLLASSRSTVGGATPASRNVISGNGSHGVRIQGSGPLDATANRVVGNLIGTDLAGAVAIGNGGHGVDVFGASRNTVGGRAAGDRNVISGNGRFGVNFLGASASRNTVIGNVIGLDADGRRALGNLAGGVFGLGNANTIGGTDPGDRNVISGNSGPGVSLQGGTSEGGVPVPNLVLGNFIGTDATGQGALGNVEAGVRLLTNNAIVGGDSPAAGNRIAHTRRDAFGRAAGVALLLSSRNNAILSNAIHANEGLGIDFNQDGQPLPNDPLDLDSSAVDGRSNEGQNHPVIDRVETGGGVTVVRGLLHSAPNTSFRLQFFGNDRIHPSGFGEGQFLLGEVFVATDAEGDAPFDATFGVGLAGSQFVSATATDPAGNTSEFSRSVGATVLPSADLAIATSISPPRAWVGQDLTIAVTVTNPGPDAATGVVVTDRPPLGSAIVPGEVGFRPTPTGEVVAELGTIPAGESRTVVYVVRPTLVGTFANEARVATEVIDPDPSNDVARAEVVILPRPGQSVLAFESTAFTASGSDGVARVTVVRANGLGPVSVRYASVGGTGTPGVDAPSVSGSLEFAEGEQSKTIEVALADHLEAGGPRSIVLALFGPTGDAALGTPFATVVHVLGDEPTVPANGHLRLGVSSVSASGADPFVTIPVERVEGSEGEARARLRTIGGSAVGHIDFEPIDLELVWGPGDDATRLVEVRLIGQGSSRPARTFSVELADAVGAPLAGPSVAEVSLTPVDDEQAPPEPTVTVGFVSGLFFVDPATGLAEITLERVGGVEGRVALLIVPSAGPAVPGVDYVDELLPVIFEPGQARVTITLPLLANRDRAGDRAVGLFMTPPTGGATLDAMTSSVLIIPSVPRDPEPPPRVLDVQFVGPARSPIGLLIRFSTEIDPALAIDPRAYSIVSGGPDGVLDTLDDRVMPIADLSYDPTTRTVALVTASPLHAGPAYRLAVDGQTGLAIRGLDGAVLDGNADGRAGGYFFADLARSATHRYRDARGNQVELRIRGGALLDLVRHPGADAGVVRVIPTGPGRQQLTGDVRRVRGVGDGVTTIGRIEGVAPFGLVDVRLPHARFAVGQISAPAVDALLAGAVSSPIRDVRIDFLN